MTSQNVAPTASLRSDDGSSIDLRPLSCSEFKRVVGHAGKITPEGKPDISRADVTDRLALPDWLAQLHHLFGDTDETLAANKINNAAWDKLCAQ